MEGRMSGGYRTFDGRPQGPLRREDEGWYMPANIRISKNYKHEESGAQEPSKLTYITSEPSHRMVFREEDPGAIEHSGNLSMSGFLSKDPGSAGNTDHVAKPVHYQDHYNKGSHVQPSSHVLTPSLTSVGGYESVEKSRQVGGRGAIHKKSSKAFDYLKTWQQKMNMPTDAFTLEKDVPVTGYESVEKSRPVGGRGAIHKKSSKAFDYLKTWRQKMNMPTDAFMLEKTVPVTDEQSDSGFALQRKDNFMPSSDIPENRLSRNSYRLQGALKTDYFPESSGAAGNRYDKPRDDHFEASVQNRQQDLTRDDTDSTWNWDASSSSSRSRMQKRPSSMLDSDHGGTAYKGYGTGQDGVPPTKWPKFSSQAEGMHIPPEHLTMEPNPEFIDHNHGVMQAEEFQADYDYSALAKYAASHAGDFHLHERSFQEESHSALTRQPFPVSAARQTDLPDDFKVNYFRQTPQQAPVIQERGMPTTSAVYMDQVSVHMKSDKPHMPPDEPGSQYLRHRYDFEAQASSVGRQVSLDTAEKTRSPFQTSRPPISYTEPISPGTPDRYEPHPATLDGQNRGRSGVAARARSEAAPRGTGPPQRGTGPPQRSTGPPQRNTGPPQRDTVPPQRGTGPPQRDTGPPHMITGPPQRNAGPPKRNAGPSQQNAGPPKQNTGPPQQNAGPSQKGMRPPQRTTGPNIGQLQQHTTLRGRVEEGSPPSAQVGGRPGLPHPDRSPEQPRARSSGQKRGRSPGHPTRGRSPGHQTRGRPPGHLRGMSPSHQARGRSPGHQRGMSTGHQARGRSPGHARRISDGHHARGRSPGHPRGISPGHQARGRSPGHPRVISPGHQARGKSPGHPRGVSPGHQARGRSPDHSRGILPGHQARGRSPDHPRGILPGHQARGSSPGHPRRISPGHQARGRSPGHPRGMSPGHQARERSPDHSRRNSPGHVRGRSPGHIRGRSPGHQVGRMPAGHQARGRSPGHPLRGRSPGHPRGRSAGHQRRMSPGHLARGKSLAHQRERSPAHPRGRSPTHPAKGRTGHSGGRSPGHPVRGRSPGHQRGRSPGHAVSSRAPGHSKGLSPGHPVRGRSPVFPRDRSLDHPRSRSPGHARAWSPGDVRRSSGPPRSRSPYHQADHPHSWGSGGHPSPGQAGNRSPRRRSPGIPARRECSPLLDVKGNRPEGWKERSVDGGRGAPRRLSERRDSSPLPFSPPSPRVLSPVYQTDGSPFPPMPDRPSNTPGDWSQEPLERGRAGSARGRGSAVTARQRSADDLRRSADDLWRSADDALRKDRISRPPVRGKSPYLDDVSQSPKSSGRTLLLQVSPDLPKRRYSPVSPHQSGPHYPNENTGYCYGREETYLRSPIPRGCSPISPDNRANYPSQHSRSTSPYRAFSPPPLDQLEHHGTFEKNYGFFQQSPGMLKTKEEEDEDLRMHLLRLREEKVEQKLKQLEEQTLKTEIKLRELHEPESAFQESSPDERDFHRGQQARSGNNDRGYSSGPSQQHYGNRRKQSRY